MRHLVLFLYFLFLSSGFAGISVSFILWKRTGDRFMGWISAVLVSFTLWLIITMINYYARRIIGVSIPVVAILNGVNFMLGTFSYLFMFVALLSSKVRLRPWFYLLCLGPIFLYYLLILIGSTLLPALLAPAADYPHLYGMFSVAAGSAFVGLVGYGYLRSAELSPQDTIRFLRRWLGWGMIGFSGIIFLTGLILTLGAADFQPAITLEFLFFFLWNITVLIAFLRYLTRPSAFIEEGKISEAFIKEFKISAREAEVIALVARGLSNKEIAESLHVSFTTVRTHLYNIFRKVGAGSRVELLQIASGYRQ